MAKLKTKKIYLSRYFDKNCQFVASMCPRCYEEQYDVKILGVNNKFLEKYPSSETLCFNSNFGDEIFYILDEPDFEKTAEKFIPPKSPHNLIEESLYTNPWALLVATIFLNKTSCYQAGPYISDFLKDYSCPEKVLESKPKDLEKYFTKLGLVKRSVQIWRMTHDYLNKNWRDVGELYGIGKYGQDAYQMFVRGNMEVEPNDRFLRIYKAWYEKIAGFKPKILDDSDFIANYKSEDEFSDCSKESSDDGGNSLCNTQEVSDENYLKCNIFENNNFKGEKSKYFI